MHKTFAFCRNKLCSFKCTSNNKKEISWFPWVYKRTKVTAKRDKNAFTLTKITLHKTWEDLKWTSERKKGEEPFQVWNYSSKMNGNNSWLFSFLFFFHPTFPDATLTCTSCVWRSHKQSIPTKQIHMFKIEVSNDSALKSPSFVLLLIFLGVNVRGRSLSFPAKHDNWLCIFHEDLCSKLAYYSLFWIIFFRENFKLKLMAMNMLGHDLKCVSVVWNVKSCIYIDKDLLQSQRELQISDGDVVIVGNLQGRHIRYRTG